MKVSEAIDRLKVGDTVWVKGEVNYTNKAELFSICCDLATTSFWICDDDEISLTEPTSLNALAQEYDVEPDTIREWLDRGHKGSFEKEIVSQEFADWVEKAKTVKDGLDYKNWCVKEIATIGWGNWLHDPERILDGKVIYDKWVNAVADNKEKHIKAIYDGYTVKPKRWVVKDSECEYVYDLHLNRAINTAHISHGTTHISNGTTLDFLDVLTFTDHAKAEAVAVLIDGTVEEL